MVREFSDTTQMKRFFATRGGRSLGIQGREAQTLAYYILSSPCFDISGHYSLRLKAMTVATGFDQTILKNLFSYLHAVHFCSFDFQKQRVFVPVVAEIFTKLFAKQAVPYLPFTPLTEDSRKGVVRSREVVL